MLHYPGRDVVGQGYFDVNDNSFKGTISHPNGQALFGTFDLEGLRNGFIMSVEADGLTEFHEYEEDVKVRSIDEHEFWTNMN